MSNESVCKEIGKKRKRARDESSSIPPQQGPPGTLNAITRCAACKLLRRRCAQECPFSPYFSPHEPHKFASVHKVFGASNVSKMLMEVPENERADTANSLVYEANVRLRDPVYGCMGVISSLQHQVQALQARLAAVKAEILIYKYREGNMIPSSSQPHVPFLSSSAEVVSMAVPPPPPPAPPLSPLYNPPVVAADYSTISSDTNVTYFLSTFSDHQLNS